MDATSLFRSILDWLRAGYPEGVPGSDRVPLLALLKETPLSEEQIKEVMRELTAPDSPALEDGVIDVDEIEQFRRVAAKLAAAGWPLTGTGGSAE
jgi:hypothetical protein